MDLHVVRLTLKKKKIQFNPLIKQTFLLTQIISSIRWYNV